MFIFTCTTTNALDDIICHLTKIIEKYFSMGNWVQNYIFYVMDINIVSVPFQSEVAYAVDD